MFNKIIGALREKTLPLARTHAHSDSDKTRPLTGALDNGFMSIEADTWLVDGKLLVGHDFESLDPQRTLEDVYLKLLRERVQKNKGQVYSKSPESLQLMLDVKTEAQATYHAIENLLSRYKDILTVFEGGTAKQGAVTVVLSGNRATDFMAQQQVRYAAYDGRLPDLSLSHPPSPVLSPMISDTWKNYFTWNGNGDMPAHEREKLHRIVAAAHHNGQRIRFWDTEDNIPGAREAVWKELIDAGVDYISSDHQTELRDWLLRNTKGPSTPVTAYLAKP